MTRIVRLKRQVPRELIAPLKNRHLDQRHYDQDQVFGGEAIDIYKPDGSLLGLLRPGALSTDDCEAAYPALYKFGRRASDRGRRREFMTAIVGYYQDKTKLREPGLTALTRNDPVSWARVQPYIRVCSGIARRHNVQLEGRYVNQRIATNTNPKYRIGNTAFSTMAINLWDDRQDGRSPAHPDDGDLASGFAFIHAFRTGNYSGGHLVFPAYRVAFDLQYGDVMMYDPHEMHGNAPIVGQPGWQRMSTVLFFLAALQASPQP